MASTSLNPSDVNKLVLESFTSGWKSYQPKYPYIFEEREPQRKDEKFSITASGGDITQVAEGAAFPQVDITEVGNKTVSQLEYKESLPVTELLRRFDNYGTVVEEASKQGYRARLTMDRVGATLISNATTTTTTWDGLALANASHLIGNTGVTQSNVVSGALTESTLNTAIINLRKMKDHNNQEMALMPRTLLVPANLAKKAFELTASQGSPESANRNSNFFNTLGLNVVVWELLTSTTAWMLLADKVFTRFRYLISIPPKVEYIRRPETGNYEYQLSFDMGAGVVDYLGAEHSTGT
ncbi:MAG: hypothetical protein A4E53_01719 [Pelotomaculum sp. PtaB.Bin104]|nr:MAG: hypothetical protein A4E53_01719 [Pelotomaculum sp. PtaB.Bin104]